MQVFVKTVAEFQNPVTAGVGEHHQWFWGISRGFGGFSGELGESQQWQLGQESSGNAVRVRTKTHVLAKI